MTLIKPNSGPTVRLIARDEATQQSRSLTVYNTTPSELIGVVHNLLAATPAKKETRHANRQ